MGFKSSPGDANEQLQFRTPDVKSQNVQRSLVRSVFTAKQKMQPPCPTILPCIRSECFPREMGCFSKWQARSLEGARSVTLHL